MTIELTETKKLLVPSARSKKSGNNFNHVSSPYITSFPVPFSNCFALICANHVSWVARVEVVSDSAKFKITSTKEGIEPVVIAFTRGMVMVGEVAWAVNGRAEPCRTRLDHSELSSKSSFPRIRVPLNKSHTALFAKDEVAPECIDYHEDQFVEGWLRWVLPLCLAYHAIPA